MVNYEHSAPKKAKIDAQDQDISTSLQIDSHVRTFLEEIMKKTDKSAKKVHKVDACVQTNSEELGVNEEDIRQWDNYVSENLYPDYDENNYSESYQYEEPLVSKDKVKTIMNKWIHQYESWFKNHFGFDLNNFEDQILPEEMKAPHDLIAPTDASLTTESIATISKSILDNANEKPKSSLEKELTSNPVFYEYSNNFEQLPNEVSFPGFNQILNSYIFSDPFVKLVQMNTNQPLIQSHTQNQQCPQNIPLEMYPDLSGKFPRNPFHDFFNSMHSLTANDSKYQAEIEEAQISAMLAAALMVCNDQSKRVKSEARWGPHLRYGTYGRLDKNRTSFSFFKRNNDPLNAAIEASIKFSPPSKDENISKRWMPPAPPTLVLLKKQSLICTLQEVIKDKLAAMKKKENALLKMCDNGLMIPLLSLDWSEELRKICLEYAFLEPVYIFRSLSTLPVTEMNYYLSHKPAGISERALLNAEKVICSRQLEEENDIESSCPHTYQPTTDTIDYVKNMIICDLMIGTVFICQTLADDRRQAKECAARMAMNKLAVSNFLVGSVRSWAKVDFLSVCLSPSADLVPCLPPFLYDPTECLPSEVCDANVKFDPISKEPYSNFTISNPKSIDEFWFYLADIPISNIERFIDLDRLLAQSCLFSQIKITFEMNIDTDLAMFLCYALVDNCKRVSLGVGTNAVQARAQASANFIFKLRDIQPIIGLNKETELDQDYVNAKSFPLSQVRNVSHLWGLTSGKLVKNLMWADREVQGDKDEEAILITQIPDSLPERLEIRNSGAFDKLLSYLQSYAASAIVCPVIVTSEMLDVRFWPNLEEEARSWHLLTCITNDAFSKNLIKSSEDYLLICKQKPLPRLKATLLNKGHCGDFVLLSRGNLSDKTTKRIMEFDTLVDEKDPESHLEVEKNVNIAEIKKDPETEEIEQKDSDCYVSLTELNSKDAPYEILDDLPKHLIPGIDF